MIHFSPSRHGFFHEGLAALPADAVEVSSERYAELMAGQARGQRIVPGPDHHPTLIDPAPAPASVWARAFVQAHLDAVAQRAGYDDMATAVTYASEPAVPRYQLEGQALRAWRSLVWHAAHEWLADHPDTFPQQLLANLPPAPEF